MSATADTLVRRHRLSVQDYHRMADARILRAGERVELINGEIIDMTPIGSRHAAIVRQLNRLLHRDLGEQGVVLVQDPIVLGQHSEPEPDIVVVRYREDFYAAGHPVAEDVLLVIEVADTSLPYDRDNKVPLYARHGIPEVWLVDLNARTVTRYHTPADGEYRHSTQHRTGSLTSLQLPHFGVDLDALLR
jgi:Uma2 family endonuclease